VVNIIGITSLLLIITGILVFVSMKKYLPEGENPSAIMYLLMRKIVLGVFSLGYLISILGLFFLKQST
jgi:hypothetical protein